MSIIGSHPLGTPAQNDIDDLQRVLRRGRPAGTIIWHEANEPATRILRAAINNPAVAKEHKVIFSQDAGQTTFKLRIAGPKSPQTRDESASRATILRTLAAYAQKIRQREMIARYEEARQIGVHSDGYIAQYHPANLFYTAYLRGERRDPLLHTPSANVQPGYPVTSWAKPVATVFNIRGAAPLTMLESLVGSRLSDHVELPDTLDKRELEAWNSLIIRSASQHQVPLGPRINLTLEPALHHMRDPEPGTNSPNFRKAWRELASLAVLS